MKYFASFLLIFFALSAFSKTKLKEVKNFGSNPGNLRMFIYTPKNLPKNKKVALVVALHGCNQNANTIAVQSGWNKLADLHGFIVLYPEQKRSNNPSKCFNWYRMRDRYNGEAFSIKYMIDYVMRRHPIDEKQVFNYGLSAGAVMASTLLVNEPCLFNTGAVLAGLPYHKKLTPSSSVKLLTEKIEKTSKEWRKEINQPMPCKPKLVVLHGKKDIVVNPKHSEGLVKQWCALNTIDSLPSKIEINYKKNPLVTKQTYVDSNGVTQISFYKMKGIGHALPIDPGEENNKGGSTGLFARDKNFHSTYYIAKDFGLIQ